MEWIDIIQQVGFPIACVIALGVFVYKIWQQSKDREDKLFTALSDATAVNQQCVDRLASMDARLETIEAVIIDK